MVHPVLNVSRKRQSRGFRCNICNTKWSQMKLRSQIILRLVFIIITLFLIYITVIIYIFERYYIKDVKKHFAEELEYVHLSRTSNMTVGISS